MAGARQAAAEEREAQQRDTAPSDAHCPHCLLVVAESVEGDWPPGPTRCPHGRLMIGPGRAREAGDGTPGARGAAAGVFAREAQR